ncbi:MAG: ribosomal protein S18-alanine N-acetyltransferase [Pyrobaculum sp.]|uniref:ribosomal protein S18-alanine N-acetyltransferase n=1 Tax=unclassified Pyrobaculum TaxID=2643434 RepID=UPI0021D90F5B|nr:ribosomal protein S18-alanine N-acetyltransferase [Pyrobaculum sp. 3827-6]MCU7786503.1 ribosomal protein S18-alanine N-acetyltransferase [Pyrobaculum sp. 3827-6]
MIRRCQALDIPRILEIEHVSFKQDDVYSEDLLRFLCAYCNDHSYVYVTSGGVVGYIITCIEGNAAHVISIAVAPEYRRRGVGRALLCTALQLLATGRVAEVFLEVRVSNTPALSLYRAAGFEISETLKSYYGDGEDGYRLVLRDKKRAREFCLDVKEKLHQV